MASTLKVDNIIATDGTTAPITLSGDAATLGSAVTFPAGHILQVKQAMFTTETALGNNSYTTTGLTDSITGSSATDSTFIIIATFTIGEITGTTNGYDFRISRDGSQIANTNTNFISNVQANNPGDSLTDSITLMAKEAPSSTNDTTYTYRVDYKRTTSGGGSAVINPDGIMSTIMIFEVAGQST